MPKLTWIISFIFLYTLQAYSQDTTKLSLVFVGDIMQHDSQIAGAHDKERNLYDYNYCFQYVSPIIEEADIAFGNLEVTLGGAPYKGYPQFSAPDELAVSLKEVGFDVLVTANNHCVDRGMKGLERTIKLLDSLQIQHTGTFADSMSRSENHPLIITKNGFRLALLNYTYGTNGLRVSAPNIVNFIDTTMIKEDLRVAKEMSVDNIIVFLHWGNEYQTQPNAFQKKIAKLCFDHGADLVIGAHPHVLQPVEWDKDANRLVIYSLGNFVSGQRTRYRDGGAILHVMLQKIESDSSTSSAISDARYELVWVKVDEAKRYTILPVKEFERDATPKLAETDKIKFETFTEDARSLYGKYNVNVSESARSPIDTLYYKILLTMASDSLSAWSENGLLAFYDLHNEMRPDTAEWMTGKFHDREVARAALVDIIEHTPIKDARIVRFWWGRRNED